MVRNAARRAFPSWAADRAMRYERQVRRARGVVNVARLVRERLGREVLGGPFAGMTLVEGFEEFAASPVLKLTGQYESVFHAALERAIALGPRVVVNVGCADGYYAVGLARRLPEAQVFAHDLAPTARAETTALARANGVSTRVEVLGRCRSFPAGTGLVVCDIEGGEDDLLHTRGLRGAAVLVETHELERPGVTDRLCRRFEPTHSVDVLPAVPADACLLDWLDADDLALALDELRTSEQSWLAMWPRDG